MSADYLEVQKALYRVESGYAAGPDRLSNTEARHKADYLASRRPVRSNRELVSRVLLAFSRI
ncbi:MAG: hypothetical protein AB7N24_09875 [Dehalococcoidia bacterium]